jgi:hypothetical protein
VTEIIWPHTAPRAGRYPRGSALLLGLALFVLLCILHIPLRGVYVPTEDDISNLATSLLLAPDAHWYHWFSRGCSLFFDLYPDWPARSTEFAWVSFTRPAFQFVVYLSHFVLGTDWASYQLINCFAVAGTGAVAFQIARTALRLRTGASFVSAILVVLSPPLWVSWLSGLGYAIEPLATVLVSGAFLLAFARRDFLCLALLFLAILTKENTLWAPITAGITIMLCPRVDESPSHRMLIAAAMLLPVALWLGLRFAFFGSIGGTYATAGYTSLADFLALIFSKLTHLHNLFVTHKPPELFALAPAVAGASPPSRGMAILILDRGTALLIYALLFLWVLRILPYSFYRLRDGIRDMRWARIDADFLVALWAAIAVAFYLAVPLDEDRYATSVVVFAWPALVAEVERRGKPIIWLGLVALCAASLTRTSYLIFETIAEPSRNGIYRSMNAYRSMDAVLAQVPTRIRRLYVLSAGGLQVANPKYVSPILGVSAEIVRVAEIVWNCQDDVVGFDHKIAEHVVSMTVMLPTCAHFSFFTDRFNRDLANGRLDRNDTMSYEFPEADLKGRQTSPYLGRKMTVRVRPNGFARFIIQHGNSNGIAWFDTR